MFAPTSPIFYKVENVKYRASAPEFVIIALINFITLLQLTCFAGLLVVFFLIPMNGFILYASNKKKKYLIDRLKQKYSEQMIIDVIKKGFDICVNGDKLITTIETDSAVFTVSCGRPGKCIEYDKTRTKIFATVVGSITIVMIIAYILKPDLLPLVLFPLIIVLALLSKYNLCKTYSVVPIMKN